MALTNPVFSANQRIRNAAENAPPMRRGESDEEAVRILQNALLAVHAGTFRRSIRRDGSLDGDYGSETVATVSRFQERVGLAREGRGDGIAGRLTISQLDTASAAAPPAQASLTPAPIVTPNPETPETLGPSSVQIPSAADLRREYGRFREIRGKPCGQGGISNQCAIRMSVALMRCDIGFFFDRSAIEYTHSATNRSCGTGVEHNASASRLMGYLKTIWTFHKYSKTGSGGLSATQIQTAVSGRSGIIYFEDCFRRSNNTAGDHIDYWDGEHTMNDLLAYNAQGEWSPGDGRSSDRWFRNSPRNIWFLPVRGG